MFLYVHVKGAFRRELSVANVTLKVSALLVRENVLLEMLRPHKRLAAGGSGANEASVIGVFFLVALELAGRRERPLAALKRAGIGFAAGVRASVRLESAGLVEELAAAGPGAPDVRLLVVVAPLVRGQGVAAVVPLAASLLLADVRGVALVVRLHVQLQCALGRELLRTVGHVAVELVWPHVKLLVTPQVIDGGESSIAALHLADKVLALEVSLLVTLQLELGVKCPNATLNVAL